jgi:hypothetical protein
MLGRDGRVKPVAMLPDPAELPQKGDPGPPGIGLPGKDAEPTINFRGDWKRAEYVNGDVVTLAGQTWIATAANKSKPGVGNGWSLFAAKGDRGPAGERIVEYYKRVVVTFNYRRYQQWLGSNCVPTDFITLPSTTKARGTRRRYAHAMSARRTLACTASMKIAARREWPLSRTRRCGRGLVSLVRWKACRCGTGSAET